MSLPATTNQLSVKHFYEQLMLLSGDDLCCLDMCKGVCKWTDLILIRPQH